MAQWLRDCRKEVERVGHKTRVPSKKSRRKKRKPKRGRNTRARGAFHSDEEDEDEDETEEEEEEEGSNERLVEEERNGGDGEVARMIQKRKEFLSAEVELMHMKRSTIKWVLPWFCGGCYGGVVVTVWMGGGRVVVGMKRVQWNEMSSSGSRLASWTGRQLSW